MVSRFTENSWQIWITKEKSKKHSLTKEDRKNNKKLAISKALNENVIGMLKHFKIIADKYRNRRKRCALRFNLTAVLYNWELKNWSYARGLMYLVFTL